MNSIRSIFRNRNACFLTDFELLQPIPLVISFATSLVKSDSLSFLLPIPITIRLSSLSSAILGADCHVVFIVSTHNLWAKLRPEPVHSNYFD